MSAFQAGVIASCLAVAAMGGAAAAQEGTPAAAKPAASDLQYFVGQWRVAARDPRTGKTEAMTYRVEPVLSGTWFAGAGASEQPGFQARDMWGRDPSTGGVIRMAFDGGGSFASLSSPGRKGDTLVLEGEARHEGGTTRVHQTITRVGPDEFRAVWEALRGGVWTAYSDEKVTRRPVA
ncbi:MAG TPA: hypothetical protein VF559_01995 [Caulobacteraceae bacterium]|jgi:hypothetical protein